MKQIRQFFATPPVNTARFSLHGIGVQEPMPPVIVDRPGGTGDYLFMFFYDEVCLRVDGADCRRPPNTLMIWEPSDGHYYGNARIPWKHSWLHGDGEAIGRFLADEGLPLATPIALPDPTLVETPLQAIYREVMDHLHPNETVVLNLLQNWIIDIRRASTEDTETPAIPRHMLEAKYFIEEHYRRHITLEKLAAFTHLSVPYFCSEFRRCFGVSAIDYLIQVRLHQAAYLLRDRNLSVTDVARAVGYPDIYYFSRLFKKHYGVSPRQMRKSQTTLD